MISKTIFIACLIIALHSKMAHSEIIYIGHAYGNVGGNVIPYPPLRKFLEKNSLPLYRVWGGDLTYDHQRFDEFDEYISKLGGVNLYVRGNHDGDLFKKTKIWQDYITANNEWIYNFDMNPDMGFSEIPTKQNIIVSHYAWFRQVYIPWDFVNNDMGLGDAPVDLSKQKFDENSHIYIAGDCGVVPQKTAGYAKTNIGKNQFVCTGLGGGDGMNNVVIINGDKIIPIFFDVNGEIIKHECTTLNAQSGFGNLIEICGGKEIMKEKGYIK